MEYHINETSACKVLYLDLFPLDWEINEAVTQIKTWRAVLSPLFSLADQLQLPLI